MKQELRERVRRVLPEKLANSVIDLYKRGRARAISARYGNPAGTVRVIAVTGVYGKTTTAKLIAELLKEAGRKVETWIERDNDEMDIVANLQQALKQAKQNETEFFILEVNAALVESGALSGVSVDTVVVTSQNNEATVLLEQAVNYAVVPDGDLAGMLALAEHQIMSFGEQASAEMKIDEITLYRRGTELKLTIDHHTPIMVASHLVGRANAYNVAAAVATVYVLGVALDTVEEGAARLEAVRGNYEYTQDDHPYTTVRDSASHDRSIELVVSSGKELTKRRMIVALESKGLSDEAVAYAKKQTDRLIIVSDADKAMAGVEVVPSIEEAWLVAQRAAKKDDTVLLLGKGFTKGQGAPIVEAEK